MENTIHSAARMQQRGANDEVVSFILKYGSRHNTHEHQKFYINKKKLNNLRFKEKDFIRKNDKQILKTIVVANLKSQKLITIIKNENKRIRWN